MKHANKLRTLTGRAALVAALAIGTASVAFAAASRAYLHSYNLPGHGVAIEGYSPVSYFTVGKAVRGKRDFSVEHNGVTYFLTSEREQQQFRVDPEKYVPAYGGWCAFGMAVEDKFPIDPHSFKIVDGKLNLFLKNKSIDALELWNKGDEPDLIGKAAAHWRKVSS